MSWFIAAYIFALFVGPALGAALAAFAWRQRHYSPGMAAFTVWFSGIAIWQVGYLLFLISPDFDTQVFWFKVTQIGSVLQAPTVFVAALYLGGRGGWATRGLLGLLGLEVAATWAVVLTNEAHSLFWSSLPPNTAALYPPLGEVPGPWAQGRLLYASILSIAALTIIFLGLPKASPVYRFQTLLILLSSMVPWLALAVSYAGFHPFGKLDLTPGSYAVIFAIWAVAVLRRQLFDIVPVARSAVFEDIQDAVIVDHADGRILDVNPAAQLLLGRSAAQCLGRPTDEVLAAWPNLCACLRPGADPQEVVVEAGAPARSLEFQVLPWKGAGARPVGWLVIGRDVTTRRRVEELSVLHAISSAAGRSLSAGDVVTTLRQALKNGLNAPAGWVFLYDAAGENLQLQTSWGLPDDLLAVYRSHPAQVFRHPSTAARDRVGRCTYPFSQHREWQSSLYIPLLAQGEVLGLVEVFSTTAPAFPHLKEAFCGLLGQEIGAAIRNAALYEQVEAARQELQRLSQQLVEVQEAERRFIATELHDEVGQHLTALRLALGRITQSLNGSEPAALHDANALVLDVMQRVRQLSLDLRPAMLDDLGLLPALLWYIDRYTQQTGIRVDFRATGMDGRFHPTVETTAYRIVQEALTNVARHAQVTAATVRVWRMDQVVSIQIEDAGAGFPVQDTLARGESSGIAGMRHRVRVLGGRLAIESSPGQGTRVFAELPYAEPDIHGDRPGPGPMRPAAG